MTTNREAQSSPVLTASSTVLVMCVFAWGALGVLSFAEPEALPTAAHWFLCILLGTVTTSSVNAILNARLSRDIHVADDGYAAGYADGLDAQPAAPNVTRLVPSSRR